MVPGRNIAYLVCAGERAPVGRKGEEQGTRKMLADLRNLRALFCSVCSTRILLRSRGRKYNEIYQKRSLSRASTKDVGCRARGDEEDERGA